MLLLLQVFSLKSAAVHEEAIMCVGAMADAVEGEFGKYMDSFMPHLQVRFCATNTGDIFMLKMRDYTLKLMNFMLKMMELYVKNEEFCVKNEEFCIKNEEFCIKNEEFCIKNE